MLSPRVPDLESLELLVAIADTGSLSRAGAARGLGQPAASARLRRMEALVGLTLVERSARGSTLTPPGSLLADWARDVLAAAAVLDAGIASLRGDRDARLRVAASLTIAEHLLPRWLAELAARRPGTAVSMTAAGSAEVAADVVAGRAALGFVEGPSVPAGLTGEMVGRDRLVVVVAPGHPWTRRRRPLTPGELAAARLVSREEGSGTRAALAAAVLGADRSAVLAEPALVLSSTAAVRAAVQAGAGPAVLSDLAVAEDLAQGRLVEVPVDDLDARRRLRAVWPAGSRPTGPARDLLAVARRAAPQRQPAEGGMPVLVRPSPPGAGCS